MSVKSPSKALNVSLWAVQILLGAAFVMAGTMKLGTPPDQMVADGMAWAGRVPAGLIKFIGLSELLGGMGLVLPAATRILPKLTPVAATGLVAVMVLAFGEHALHGEFAAAPAAVVLGALAAFVAWGRLWAAPVEARTTAQRMEAIATS